MYSYKNIHTFLTGLNSPFLSPFSFTVSAISSFSFELCLLILSFSLASFLVASSSCLALSFNSSCLDNNCCIHKRPTRTKRGKRSANHIQAFPNANGMGERRFCEPMVLRDHTGRPIRAKQAIQAANHTHTRALSR